jgi:L-methionine (R)-S-oxide reductase
MLIGNLTMISPELTNKVVSKLDSALSNFSTSETNKAIQTAMQLLHDEFEHYHWVGVYFLKGNTLVLGPYVGPETEHTHIPVGRGVCGTAVAENTNQIVDDVRRLSNYLACNLETRSEIVVLIRDPKTNRILGQIDIDGTEVGGFDQSDEKFLEEVAKRLVKFIL